MNKLGCGIFAGTCIYSNSQYKKWPDGGVNENFRNVWTRNCLLFQNYLSYPPQKCTYFACSEKHLPSWTGNRSRSENRLGISCAFIPSKRVIKIYSRARPLIPRMSIQTRNRLPFNSLNRIKCKQLPRRRERQLVIAFCVQFTSI